MGDLEQRILSRFRELYAAGSPFREDLAHGDEMGHEAAPVVNTLLRALDTAGDRSARSEALAMMTLLGRRAGALGLTPTAGLSVVRSLLDASTDSGATLAPDLARELQSMAWEGYVQGREDRLDERHATELSDAHQPIVVHQGVPALVLVGRMDAPRLLRLLDRFGRALLKLDAKACVVDLAGLLDPAPDKAAEAFAADAAARTVGARCYFTGVSDAWHAAAVEGRVTVSVLHFAPSFDVGVRLALEHAGLVIAAPAHKPAWAFWR